MFAVGFTVVRPYSAATSAHHSVPPMAAEKSNSRCAAGSLDGTIVTSSIGDSSAPSPAGTPGNARGARPAPPPPAGPQENARWASPSPPHPLAAAATTSTLQTDHLVTEPMIAERPNVDKK